MSDLKKPQFLDIMSGASKRKPLVQHHQTGPIVASEPDPASLPKATHAGELEIGGVKVPCFVLEDETALISKRGVVALLSNGRESGHLDPYIDGIPNKPDGFSLGECSFKTPNGVVAHGLTTEKVTTVMQLYLAALVAGQLRPSQQHIGLRCASIVSALAAENLTKKVHEATGFSKAQEWR